MVFDLPHKWQIVILTLQAKYAQARAVMQTQHYEYLLIRNFQQTTSNIEHHSSDILGI